MRAERIPKWEAELWSYISSGNGETCPLYDRCQVRRKRGWCPSEYKKDIGRLLDGLVDINRRDFVKAEGESTGRVFQLVEMLAHKYLKRTKTHGPPVPAEIISQFDLGQAVEIRPVPLKAYHGAIWRMEDGWVIHLNTRDSDSKKRFTLFHEAFHILAHCRTAPVFRRRGVTEGRFSEHLADYFATCVLLPREWIEERWVEVKDVGVMAKIFNVPKAAMWFRLRQLGLV